MPRNGLGSSSLRGQVASPAQAKTLRFAWSKSASFGRLALTIRSRGTVPRCGSVPLTQALGPAFTADSGASSLVAFCPINLRGGLVHHPTKRPVICDAQPTGISSRMPAPVHRVGVSDHPVYAAKLYSVAQAQSAGSHLVAALVSATLGPNYSIKGNGSALRPRPLISGVRPCIHS